MANTTVIRGFATMHVIGTAAMLAAAAAGGWVARGSAEPAAIAATPVPASQRTAPLHDPAAAVVEPLPVIAVSSDGNVTLRVEQQPLQWVLEQIAARSGWSDAEAHVASAAAQPARAAAPPESATGCAASRPIDAARLLAAIERGGESERFEGLLQARSEGVPVAEQTLKLLYETDPSERVRVVAFKSYLEAQADRPEALRAALEGAIYMQSTGIQREAKQRLDELEEMQREDTLSAQGIR